MKLKILHTHTHIYMKDFDESDKMIKISGKVDKSNTTDLVVILHPLFTEILKFFIEQRMKYYH